MKAVIMGLYGFSSAVWSKLTGHNVVTVLCVDYWHLCRKYNLPGQEREVLRVMDIALRFDNNFKDIWSGRAWGWTLGKRLEHDDYDKTSLRAMFLEVLRQKGIVIVRATSIEDFRRGLEKCPKLALDVAIMGMEGQMSREAEEPHWW
jgi:hypothetical protein